MDVYEKVHVHTRECKRTPKNSKRILRITGCKKLGSPKEIEQAIKNQPIVAQVHQTAELEYLEGVDIYYQPANAEAFEGGDKHGVVIVSF